VRQTAALRLTQGFNPPNWGTFPIVPWRLALPAIRRRDALTAGAALGLSSAFTLPAWSQALPAVRRVSLHNLHTGDMFNDAYFENGRYVPDALAHAQRVLRDWRTGDEHFMDPRLFDALHSIQGKLGTGSPYQIISGYRSPKTNAMLHDRSHQVASGSQHMLGKAVDVRIQGVDLQYLHKAALNVSAGGVGYYPTSDFVHVDVGRVRQWQGS
jgi:uncharacterized protein YcbK (DUF882 family)